MSKGGVYSWYEGSKDNAFLLEKAGFVPHEHCTPYLAHVKANPAQLQSQYGTVSSGHPRYQNSRIVRMQERRCSQKRKKEAVGKGDSRSSERDPGKPKAFRRCHRRETEQIAASGQL